MPRIFIVDQEGKDLGEFLRSKGYDTLVFYRGKEAIEEIKKRKPDVIILELRLPDGDGFTFLNELEKIGITIPVIVITWVDKKIAGYTLSKMGAFAYFNKPVDRELVLKRVEYILRFKDIFEKGKVSRVPPLKSISGPWKGKIEEILKEVKSIKINEIKKAIKDGNPRRALEILHFLKSFVEKEELEFFYRSVIWEEQKVPYEEERRDNVTELINEAWKCYLSSDFDSALSKVKELLLNEEGVESIRIINGILSREGIEIEKVEGMKVKEKPNLFSYISYFSILTGVFFSTFLFSILGVIFGFVGRVKGNKKFGTYGMVMGGFLFISFLFGSKPISYYFKKRRISAGFSFYLYPDSFKLGRGSITIRYKLPKKAKVTILLLDEEKKFVREMEDGYFEKGEYTIEWDGYDGRGGYVSPGIYYLQTTILMDKEVRERFWRVNVKD
ncbi:MAG: hypothetical protein DRI36_00045 [Caldiserica bacterium]|nr:MAG: hypothetical protein DRI36_00045 [Caldisericota bacterium]